MSLENYNIGATEFKKNNYSLSVDYFTKAINENHLLGNSFSVAYFYRASSYYYLNEFEKAIEDFDEAFKALFDDFKLFLFRGLSYFNLKKYEEAIVDLKKVIELKNDFEGAYVYLYEIYRLINSDDLAKNTFVKIINLNPNNINVISKLGSKYIDGNLYDLAKLIYLDIYNLYPTSLNAIQGLAITNGHLKNHSEGIKYFDMLINLDPENADHHIKNRELSYLEMVNNEKLNNKAIEVEKILEKAESDTKQLNLNKQKVENWKKDILNALIKEGTFDMQMFNHYYNKDDTGKSFMENIAYNNKAYNYLNNLGLVNRKFCPITGEGIDESFNYTIFGRCIYLSQKGLEICHSINREEHGKRNTKLSYDEILQEKRRGKSKANRFTSIITIINAIISIYLSFIIVNPSGYFSFILFAIICVIFFFVFMWFLDVFLSDMLILIYSYFITLTTKKK